MSRASRWAVLAIILCGAAALACPAAAADKINLLIVDGQNGHDWKATTPVIKDLLTKTERFNVDVCTSPPKLPGKATDEQKAAGKEAWAKFRPDFAKYQVVLINYCGDPWPEEVAKAFEKYVQDGGGLVAYHFAVAAWAPWDAWNKMICLGWKPASFGEGISIDDAGKIVRRPKGEGPGNGHGPAHVWDVDVRDKDHPITKGMPAKLPHVKDELYHGQRGPAPETMHILSSAFSNKAGGGTGTNEPITWTNTFGKGRVFVTLLGHDGPATSDPVSTAFLTRGAEWAATGAVTLPLPKDLVAAEAK